jgi:hypothetical protein
VQDQSDGDKTKADGKTKAKGTCFTKVTTSKKSRKVRKTRKDCRCPFGSELPLPEIDASSATLPSIGRAARCGFPAPFQTARLGRGFRTARTKLSGRAQMDLDSDPAI